MMSSSVQSLHVCCLMLPSYLRLWVVVELFYFFSVVRCMWWYLVVLLLCLWVPVIVLDAAVSGCQVGGAYHPVSPAQSSPIQCAAGVSSILV
ncbi:hypothetical protein BD289DRAFT_437043 [Coniella lustricola]|uniref:Uncharacterized protein n=1 Tax=Coniella lustricola TaxID=2025994 RepID=A0A2T3A4H0_9PEZI|nr:hypothetical protein BD289DRAFT_437043 [Coniella lustricola]